METLNKVKLNSVEEYMDDKCKDCPFNDTSCPGGSWCTKED